jgi:hypothetical protein
MTAALVASTLFWTVRPAEANDWMYRTPLPPSGPPQQNNVVRNVLIGAGLIGVGYLAAKMLTPQSAYAPGYVSGYAAPGYAAPMPAAPPCSTGAGFGPAVVPAPPVSIGYGTTPAIGVTYRSGYRGAPGYGYGYPSHHGHYGW